MTLALSDLDATLVYSRNALRLSGPDELAPTLWCVEVFEQFPQSFVTRYAGALIEDLTDAGALVPVTTRTMAQYTRIRLPGSTPTYAFCANAGRLLVRGVEDMDYTRHVSESLAVTSAELGLVREIFAKAAEAPGGAVKKVRTADGLFCYAVIDREETSPRWIEDLAGLAHAHGWQASIQGRKLYLVPRELTKDLAVTYVREQLSCDRVVAAGDSLLDAPMLAAADAAVRPAHGELADENWSLPHVTVPDRVGVVAGQNIAGWLHHQVFGGGSPAH